MSQKMYKAERIPKLMKKINLTISKKNRTFQTKVPLYLFKFIIEVYTLLFM